MSYYSPSIEKLVEAFEKQIELNKKQNIKIKNQRAILKTLQQKQERTTNKSIMEQLRESGNISCSRDGEHNFEANI